MVKKIVIEINGRIVKTIEEGELIIEKLTPPERIWINDREKCILRIRVY